MLTLHNKTKCSMLDIHQSREGQSFISVIYLLPTLILYPWDVFFKIQCKIMQMKNKIKIEKQSEWNNIKQNHEFWF